MNRVDKVKKYVKEHKKEIITAGLLVGLGYLSYKVWNGDFEDESVIIETMEDGDGYVIYEGVEK